MLSAQPESYITSFGLGSEVLSAKPERWMSVAWWPASPRPAWHPVASQLTARSGPRPPIDLVIDQDLPRNNSGGTTFVLGLRLRHRAPREMLLGCPARCSEEWRLHLYRSHFDPGEIIIVDGALCGKLLPHRSAGDHPKFPQKLPAIC